MKYNKICPFVAAYLGLVFSLCWSIPIYAQNKAAATTSMHDNTLNLQGPEKASEKVKFLVEEYLKSFTPEEKIAEECVPKEPIEGGALTKPKTTAMQE